MTVRVNKPAFNLREKLSELTSKFGLKGTELARAETAQDARDLVSAGRKNIVINGDIRIAQRATSVTSVSTTGYYVADRMLTVLNNLGTWTVSQETDAPDGFKYSLKHTCTTADSGPGASDYAIVYQRIETQNIVPQIGYGSSSAKYLTLSFWVKSNKTGGASAGLFYNIGTNKFNSGQYTINNADTWEYKTITFLPAAVANTIGDTGTGMTIEWWMNSGSSFAGGSPTKQWVDDGPTRNAHNIGVGGVIGDYFQITGVQLEVGKNATDFEYRSYGEELTLCERYLNTSFTGGISVNNTSNTGILLYGGGITGSTTSFLGAGQVVFPTSMRANPTVVLYDIASPRNLNKCHRHIFGSAGSNNQQVGVYDAGPNGFYGRTDNGANASGFIFHYSADAEL